MEYREAVKMIEESMREHGITVSEICKAAGQKSRSAWYSAHRKWKWSQLSTNQRVLINKALDIIQSKKQFNPDPTDLRAEEILYS